MKNRSRALRLARFILIALALALVLVADWLVFGRAAEDATRAPPVAARPAQDIARVADAARPPPVRVVPPDGKAFFESVPPVTSPPVAAQGPDAISLPPPAPPERADGGTRTGRARIAIIIDDVGMDVRRSREAISLPAPVTLAVLPYAPKAREIAREGKAAGHELIIHVPMEAMDPAADIGPGGLRTGMDDQSFDAAFEAMLASFDGYVGINNHMGSRLTQDSAAMARVMERLKQRGLFFIDSKTVAASVGASEAARYGVPHAGRDVFLDHVETRAFADQALRRAEAIALRRGSAIAIGHPKDNTLAALRAWLPTLKEKNIELVPVSNLLMTPKIEPAPASPPNALVVETPRADADTDSASGTGQGTDLFPADQPPRYRIPDASQPSP